MNKYSYVEGFGVGLTTSLPPSQKYRMKLGLFSALVLSVQAALVFQDDFTEFDLSIWVCLIVVLKIISDKLCR